MATKTQSLTLREQIEALPRALRDAVLAVSQLTRKVDDLQEAFEQSEEADRTAVVGPDDANGSDESDADQAYELNRAAEADLRFKIDLLKIDLDVAKSRAEVEYRRSVAKATDATAKAMVAQDDDVVRLRRELAETEHALARLPAPSTVRRERLAASSLTDSDEEADVTPSERTQALAAQLLKASIGLARVWPKEGAKGGILQGTTS